MDNKKVLIIGAGPVGLLTAICLTRYGIACDIIEKRTTLSQHSKALSINAASLKVFEHLGLSEQFLSLGQKCQHIYAYWHNKKIMHIDYSRMKNKFNYFLALPQPETEKILNAEIEKYNVTVQRGVELHDIETIDDQVKVTLKNIDNDTTSMTYDYVIACDGGRSTVRKQLGLSFIGHDYDIMFKMIDCKIDWDGDKSATHYFVKENGFIIIIPLSNGMHRIVIKTNKLDEAKMASELSTAEFKQLVKSYGPKNIKVSNIIWKTQAPFYNRLIEQHRHGNVFFAGDASHLFSPIGGLGMNTGIQDAFNLSWKLAGVIHRDYSETLLDTYCNERHAIAKLLINGTDSTTKLIARIDTNTDGDLKKWLPTMSNRKLIASEYPLRFSGLGQQYLEADGIVTKNIPYAFAHDIQGSYVNSYQLLDNYKAKILVFLNTADALKKLKADYPHNDFIIVMADENNEIELGLQDHVIIDSEQSFYRAFDAENNHAYIVRPDGYITTLTKVPNAMQTLILSNLQETYSEAA